MKLESTPGDMGSWREVDFALNCTYIVPDQVSDPSFSLPKAMTSIPRNLTFSYNTDNEVRHLRNHRFRCSSDLNMNLETTS